MMDKLLELPSPIELLPLPDTDVQVYVKREDLIHPYFGGNKWRKLKYNLEQAKAGGHSDVVTFGGAFSNHIAAVAQVCKAAGIPSMGLIRGTYVDLTNPTLSKAKAAGMRIIHLSKDDYKLKAKAPSVQNLLSQLSNPFLIPEGGSNAFGVKGCSEIIEEVALQDLQPDYVVVPAGTGATAAGIISSAPKSSQILVVNVLKNPELKNTIASAVPDRSNWNILSNYHFGGFAKVNKPLIDFINVFRKVYGLSLDPIYNAKGMHAVLDLIALGKFPPQSKVLYILTGGLQGIRAYNYRCTNEELRIENDNEK